MSGCSVELADGSWSQPLNVRVFRSAEHIRPRWQGPPVPLVTVREEELEVFLDPRHELFANYDVKPEVVVATEVAHFIYMQNQRLAGSHHGEHSVAAISAAIVTRYYGRSLDLSAEGLREEISEVTTNLRRRLAESLPPRSGEDLYESLSESDQEAFARNLLASGRPLTEATAVVASGEFIDLVEASALVRLFQFKPDSFRKTLPPPTAVAELRSRRPWLSGLPGT